MQASQPEVIRILGEADADIVGLQGLGGKSAAVSRRSPNGWMLRVQSSTANSPATMSCA